MHPIATQLFLAYVNFSMVFQGCAHLTDFCRVPWCILFPIPTKTRSPENNYACSRWFSSSSPSSQQHLQSPGISSNNGGSNGIFWAATHLNRLEMDRGSNCPLGKNLILICSIFNFVFPSLSLQVRTYSDIKLKGHLPLGPTMKKILKLVPESPARHIN